MTLMEHLTAKQFLSDIKTKQDFTKYLSMKLYGAFQKLHLLFHMSLLAFQVFQTSMQD